MTDSTSPQHILILGASGATGLPFIKHHLSLSDTDPSKPYLTIYIRSSGRAKLQPVLGSTTASSDLAAHKIRIVEGSLTDAEKVRIALSADAQFPKVTAVISLLGAYLSTYYFFTRGTPTPISDALKSTIIPEMLGLGISRILVLSTPSGFPVAGEDKGMSWSWWYVTTLPKIIVPQGDAEMRGLAEAVLERRGTKIVSKPGLKATVYRIPFLYDLAGSEKREVRAFTLGGDGHTDNRYLTRESLIVWLLDEVREGRWVDGAPMLTNPN